MKFFQPQIQLVRESVFDAPDAYFMHVVTFCPRSCFRANGYEADNSELATGKLIVRVKLIQDPDLPDFEYITPLVHTFSLGSVDFPGGEGVFEVTVVADVVSGATRGVDPPTTTTQTGGTGTVGSTGSDGKSKPIDANSLYANF